MKTQTALKNTVTAIELASIKRDRDKLEALRMDVEVLARDLREREEHVIDRIEAGAPVDGEAVVLTRRRQHISWLTAFRRALGAEAVVSVKNAWPMTFSKELQIA